MFSWESDFQYVVPIQKCGTSGVRLRIFRVDLAEGQRRDFFENSEWTDSSNIEFWRWSVGLDIFGREPDLISNLEFQGVASVMIGMLFIVILSDTDLFLKVLGEVSELSPFLKC